MNILSWTMLDLIGLEELEIHLFYVVGQLPDERYPCLVFLYSEEIFRNFYCQVFFDLELAGKPDAGPHWNADTGSGGVSLVAGS